MAKLSEHDQHIPKDVFALRLLLGNHIVSRRSCSFLSHMPYPPATVLPMFSRCKPIGIVPPSLPSALTLISTLSVSFLSEYHASHSLFALKSSRV
jgi:hypothetical protein